MTPERIAAIREQHRKKAHLDYTDCSLCFEEFPCEVIEALDALAASRSSEAALRKALERVVHQVDLVDRDELIALDAISNVEDIVRAALDGAAAQTPQERSGDAPEG